MLSERRVVQKEKVKSASFCLILILAVPLVCLTAAAKQGTIEKPGIAGSGLLLADRHKAAGIECEGCHKESPPKAAPTKVCLDCHGSYDKLAAQTDKLEANPHSSHLGERDCDVCHHGHKPSEDYCIRCHQFRFKVP